MRRFFLSFVVATSVVLFAGPALAQGLTPLPQLAPFPGTGVVLAPPNLPITNPAPGPTIARAATGGVWFNGFVDDVGGATASWLGNASTLMYVLFNVLLGLGIVFALARNAAQNHSIAAWGHVFPSLLMDLLPPWAIVYAAPVFVSNALSVGLGAGSYITGHPIVGPNEMAHAFMQVIGHLLAAPFSAAAQPILSWQAIMTAPPRVLFSFIMFGAGVVLSLIVLVFGAAATLMLVYTEVDCLVVMPVAMVLVAFSANRATSGLWQGALNTWLSRVFRLVMGTAIASFTVLAFAKFATILESLNPLDIPNFLRGEFWIVLGCIVAGSLTAALPFALDSAVSGRLGLTGIDVGRQVFQPSIKALQGHVGAKRAAAAAAKRKAA